ncbi:NADP-dependent oxidoreductase domain-containing protein [Amylocarpus encephaloides]|uniref:NADP-dependent oxidoreductase domain-containing protein n=1 Tax=Amylocarpus encephaloides TaxID=45428 RepID=A0A9P7YKX7_9HELO|nr:NADP-dependent oxidoreductase domain-containing protein [Amylocarpus encephaloides]
MKNQTVKLASGYQMPLVGFGLWKVDQLTTADTVYAAIQIGYRLFDGAYDYANEKEAGEGIQRAIKDGLVKREDIFVTTKLWNNYHKKEYVAEMGKSQNETWGLGYIDLYLIHFPVALEYIEPSKLQYPGWWMDEAHEKVTIVKVSMIETWRAMEKLVDEGIVRSIGVSNFSTQLLYDVISYARHPISSLQIEHHPYLTQPQLIAMAQEEGIVITGYSTFGPQSFLELPPAFKERAKDVTMLFDHEVIKNIASKYNKEAGQVLLRWATQRNIAVIPKSNNKGRLQQNLKVNDFSMTVEELAEISTLDQGLRFNDPGFYLQNRPIRIFD